MMNSRFTTIKLSGKAQPCEPLRRFKISSLPRQGNSRPERQIGSLKTILNDRDRLEQRSVDLDMRLLTSIEEDSNTINTLGRPQPSLNQLILHRRRDLKNPHIQYQKITLKSKTKKKDEENRRIKQIKSDYHLNHRQQATKRAIERKDVPSLIRNFLEKEKEKKRKYHSMVKYQPEIIKVASVSPRRVNLHFETTFGVEPQFHMLKTIYAQTGLLTHQRHYCSETYNLGSIPQIPLKENLQTFIENYQTLGKQFDLRVISGRSDFQVEYSPEELYFGQMEYQEKEGLGVLLNQKKCFEGLFERGNKKKGYQIDRKGVYRGEFVDNQRSGIGGQEYIDGSYYSGGFKNNLKHGHGSWSNQQETYTGEWRKDKFHGYGVLKSRCGQYKGTFVDGKKQGWGRELMETEDYYEGYFSNNLPHDKGIYVWSNGTRYEGQFFNGFRTGQGTLSTVDGCVYNGSFTDQKPSGLCQIIIPESSIYKGYIKEGKKNGRGTLFLNKIERELNGFWQNDVLLTIIEG